MSKQVKTNTVQQLKKIFKSETTVNRPQFFFKTITGISKGTQPDSTPQGSIESISTVAVFNILRNVEDFHLVVGAVLFVPDLDPICPGRVSVVFLQMYDV